MPATNSGLDEPALPKEITLSPAYVGPVGGDGVTGYPILTREPASS